MNVQCLTHQSELKICQTTEIFYTISGWIHLIILFYKINRTYRRKVNCLQNHYWKKIGFQCTFGVKKYVIKLFPRFINSCIRGVKAIGPAVHYWTADCWSSSLQKMLCIYSIFWPDLKIKQNKHYEVLRCSVLWWKWKSESVEGVAGELYWEGSFAGSVAQMWRAILRRMWSWWVSWLLFFMGCCCILSSCAPAAGSSHMLQ